MRGGSGRGDGGIYCETEPGGDAARGNGALPSQCGAKPKADGVAGRMSRVFPKSGETDAMHYLLIQKVGDGPGDGGTELITK